MGLSSKKDGAALGGHFIVHKNVALHAIRLRRGGGPELNPKEAWTNQHARTESEKNYVNLPIDGQTFQRERCGDRMPARAGPEVDA